MNPIYLRRKIRNMKEKKFMLSLREAGSLRKSNDYTVDRDFGKVKDETNCDNIHEFQYIVPNPVKLK